jgi:hypothetical protein
LGGSKRIMGISLISYGKNSLDLRPTWVTTSPRERIEFVSQRSTVCEKFPNSRFHFSLRENTEKIRAKCGKTKEILANRGSQYLRLLSPCKSKFCETLLSCHRNRTRIPSVNNKSFFHVSGQDNSHNNGTGVHKILKISCPSREWCWRLLCGGSRVQLELFGTRF